MRDHELVADPGQDHARDDHDVQVRVRVAGQLRALTRELEPALGDPRDEVEVEPPERRRREEGEPERGHARRVELQLGRGRPDDHDRLAERDDQEELEALCEVRGADLPG